EVHHWLSDWIEKSPVAGNRTCRIKGFLSNNASDLRGFDIAAGILDDPDYYKVEEDDRFVLAIGTIEVKKRIATSLKERGARFFTLVHPTAVVAGTAHLGEGVVICPFATVSANVTVDDFAMLNFYASCGHDAKVGKYCILSPYATINGFGILEDEVFMGTHATVIAHKRVGFRSKISANSLAASDVLPYTLVQGVPGKAWTIFSANRETGARDDT
nr:acetyltransferase [Verrucomicrobiota bacterium]